jgi:hypothetical protein
MRLRRFLISDPMARRTLLDMRTTGNWTNWQGLAAGILHCALGPIYDLEN